MQIKIRFTSGNETTHPTDSEGFAELVRRISLFHFGDKSLRSVNDSVWKNRDGTVVVIPHIETVSEVY